MAEPRPLEGQFLGFCPSRDDGPTSFWLKTLALVERIYVPRGLREPLLRELTNGQRVRVWVERSPRGRWRSRMVVPLAPIDLTCCDDCTVQVCMNKHCCGRGGRELRLALQRACEDRQGVRVEPVGCLDHCKKGPNVKLRGRIYHRLTPIAGIALLNQHFPAGQPSPEPAPVAWPGSEERPEAELGDDVYGRGLPQHI